MAIGMAVGAAVAAVGATMAAVAATVVDIPAFVLRFAVSLALVELLPPAFTFDPCPCEIPLSGTLPRRN